jgi:DNA-binding transcriptional LysR family regulator
MTLRRLEVFLVVAKHLSVTLGARELYVTQPTISEQLKLLQDTIGARLIKKTRTGIALTPIGAAFLKDVEAIRSQLDLLETKYAGLAANQDEEVLTIGASYGPSTSLIPTLMTQFFASHPTVKLDLYRAERTRIENLLMKSQIDIAITTYPVHRAALKSEPFRTEKLSAFVPADHPFASLKEIKIAQLPKIPFVVRTSKENESRTEKLLRDLCRIGHRPKIAMRCESPEALKTAVRNGAGVGILFYDSIREEVRRNEFVVVKLAGIELKSRSYIVYCKKKPLSKPAQEFLTLLRASRHIDRVIRPGAKAQRVSSRALRGSAVA